MNTTSLLCTFRRFNLISPCFRRNLVHTPGEHMLNYQRNIIGNREIVGFGTNGTPTYFDNASIPMPAIRYMEPTSEILALHEKEKGDWRLLTLEEKKCLYRASFCQTFAEFKAPKNEWMAIVGYSLMFCSIGVWLFILMTIYVFTPLPDSFTPKNKRAQLKRMIHLHVNPITGLTSNWDYEKMDWKVKRWGTPENPFTYTEDECDDEDGDD